MLKLWKTPAIDFIKKNGFETINHLYCNPVTATTAFVESDKINTFYFLGMFFCVVSKAWIADFSNTIPRLTKGFEHKIKIGTVKKVKKRDDHTHVIQSSVGNFIAKNVVFAAPQEALTGIYELPRPYIQQEAYVIHVRGMRKKLFCDKKGVLFQPREHDVFMLWQQQCGDDIIYTKLNEPDLTRYYESYEIIRTTHWNPGMIIPKDQFIDQQIDEDIYLASDYNLSLLEDCFLTGIYAANQIIVRGQ